MNESLLPDHSAATLAKRIEYVKEALEAYAKELARPWDDLHKGPFSDFVRDANANLAEKF
jgi:hypothetical protein